MGTTLTSLQPLVIDRNRDSGVVVNTDADAVAMKRSCMGSEPLLFSECCMKTPLTSSVLTRGMIKTLPGWTNGPDQTREILRQMRPAMTCYFTLYTPERE